MNEHLRFYEFEGFRLDPAKRLLWRNGEVVPLMPKAFDVLLALVSQHGRVVGKNELMSGVWRDAVVEENSLNVNVSALRRVFDEKPHDHRFIVTVPGVGYKFVAAVRELDGTRDSGIAEVTAKGAAPSIPEGIPESDSIREVSRILRLRRYATRHQSVALALVALVLIAGTVTGLLVLKSRGNKADELERISVAVVDFSNETGEPDLNGLSGMLITSLEQSRRLSVLTRSRMFDILKQLGKSDAERIDETLGREICSRAQVDLLVIASVRKFDNLYAIDLKVLDPLKDQYLYTASEKSESKASIPEMIDRLSEATRASLNERSAEIQATDQRVADVTTPNIEAYRHYFLGEQLISKNKFDEAAEEFSQAASLDPSFGLAHYQRASMRLWYNREEAKEPLRKAMQRVEKTPEKERYMIRAMNAYVETNFEEAKALWREAIRLYPDYKEAHWAFGDFSFHIGDYDTAIFHMEKTLELDPTFEPAIGHLVWLTKEIEAHDKMGKYVSLLMERTGSTEDSYAWLCEYQRQRHDFASTFTTSRRIQELFPNSYVFTRCSGDTYIAMDEYGKAEAEYRKLINEARPLEHQQHGYRLLALIYAYEGKYREAVRMAEQSIKLAARNGDKRQSGDSYVEKAYLLSAGHGEVEAARSAVNKQVEFSPASYFGYHLLFNTYLLLGEHEKAKLLVKGDLSPFGDRVVDGYFHRAKGEFDVAINDLEPVVARGFLIDKIMRGYELAGCYLEVGQHEKAIDVLQRTQKLYSQMLPFYRAAVYPRSIYLLGKIYEKKGDHKLAIASYEKFLNLWKMADKDLPELVDAKLRLANLQRALRVPLRASIHTKGRIRKLSERATITHGLADRY
jgi:DNA-binding winged helix-turn-helix (wHTH) protein/tetratricopeptide (TPR) repeat protein